MVKSKPVVEAPPAPVVPSVQFAFTISLTAAGNYYTQLHQVGDSQEFEVERSASVGDVALAIRAVLADLERTELSNQVVRTMLANWPVVAKEAPQETVAKALKKRKASVIQ